VDGTVSRVVYVLAMSLVLGFRYRRLEDLNERRRLRVLFAGLLLHKSPQLVIRQQMGNASASMTAHYTGEIPVEV
jgi:hypothetical protein